MLLESITAAILLTSSNYADYHTTKVGISNGAVELNPIYGPKAERLLPIKIVVVGLETYTFHKIHKKNKKLAWAFVGSIVATNLIIARHNSKFN